MNNKIPFFQYALFLALVCMNVQAAKKDPRNWVYFKCEGDKLTVGLGEDSFGNPWLRISSTNKVGGRNETKVYDAIPEVFTLYQGTEAVNRTLSVHHKNAIHDVHFSVSIPTKLAMIHYVQLSVSTPESRKLPVVCEIVFRGLEKSK